MLVAEVDEFVCKNADYLDWDAFGYALADQSVTATAQPNAIGESSKPPNAANAEPPRPRPSSSSPLEQ